MKSNKRKMSKLGCSAETEVSVLFGDITEKSLVSVEPLSLQEYKDVSTDGSVI